MSADGSTESIKASRFEKEAAMEKLSLELEDIEESCDSIDADCRGLVRELLDSLEATPASEEDGNAADVLLRISKIWSQAHNIRRCVSIGGDGLSRLEEAEAAE